MSKAGIHHVITLLIQIKEKGGTGEGKQPQRRVTMLDTQMLKEKADNVKTTSTRCGQRTCGILVHVQI